MGWWRISGPSGHIKWSAGSDENGAMLFNCIPGRDDQTQLYNGDEPADILDAVINSLETQFQSISFKAEAKSVFLDQVCEIREIDFDAQKALSVAREKIEQVYQREWQRLPTPAELSAVFEFCTSRFTQVH